jgi:predicted phosphodiesterase
VDQADEVWHAGDIGNLSVTDTKKVKPLRAVYGNIDDAKWNSITQPFMCEGVDVWITHIVVILGNTMLVLEKNYL